MANRIFLSGQGGGGNAGSAVDTSGIQATANQALSTAQSAQGAAQTAQTSADTAFSKAQMAQGSVANLLRAPAPLSPLPLRLLIIGTSLVQQGFSALYDANGVATEIANSAKGWQPWMLGYLAQLGMEVAIPFWMQPASRAGFTTAQGGWRGYDGLNEGVSGQTCDQILARWSWIIEHYDFDHVLIDAGTNDVGTVAKEQIHAKRLQLCDLARAAGKTVHLLPILNRGLKDETGKDLWPTTGSQRSDATWVNAQTVKYTLETPGVFFVNWNTAWVDPASTAGAPYAGYAEDGTHFNPPGAEAVGKALAQHFARWLPARNAPLEVFDIIRSPLGNLAANPTLSGTAGTLGTSATGAVADMWTVERTGNPSNANGTTGDGSVACSVEARAGGGQNQILTFTSGTLDTNFYVRPSSASILLTTPGWQAGDWVQASFTIEASAWDGWYSFGPVLQEIAGTALGCIARGMKPSYFSYLKAYQKLGSKAMGPVRIWTPPLQISAGTDKLRLRFEVFIASAATGTGVLKVSEPTLRRCRSPQALCNFR